MVDILNRPKNIPFKYWIPIYGVIAYTFNPYVQSTGDEEFNFLIYHLFVSVGLTGYLVGYTLMLILIA